SGRLRHSSASAGRRASRSIRSPVLNALRQFTYTDSCTVSTPSIAHAHSSGGADAPAVRTPHRHSLDVDRLNLSAHRVGVRRALASDARDAPPAIELLRWTPRITGRRYVAGTHLEV